MTNNLSARSLAAAAALALAIPAHAGVVILTAEYTGSFNAATTFNGTPLGSPTDFSVTATFNASVNKYASAAPGEGLYQITDFTMTLAGHGTYVGVPDNNTNLYLYGNTAGARAVGLNSAGISPGFFSYFSSSTPAFDGSAPTPTVFNDNTSYFLLANYSLAFSGVPGGLTMKGFGATTPTFYITAVPEPMETAGVIGLSLVAFAGWRRRKA